MGPTCARSPATAVAVAAQTIGGDTYPDPEPHAQCRPSPSPKARERQTFQRENHRLAERQKSFRDGTVPVELGDGKQSLHRKTDRADQPGGAEAVPSATVGGEHDVPDATARVRRNYSNDGLGGDRRD